MSPVLMHLLLTVRSLIVWLFLLIAVFAPLE